SRCPFEAQRLAVEERVVGKTQLQHDIHRSDEAFWRADQRFLQIRCCQLPAIGTRPKAYRKSRAACESVNDDACAHYGAVNSRGKRTYFALIAQRSLIDAQLSRWRPRVLRSIGLLFPKSRFEGRRLVALFRGGGHRACIGEFARNEWGRDRRN